MGSWADCEIGCDKNRDTHFVRLRSGALRIFPLDLLFYRTQWPSVPNVLCRCTREDDCKATRFTHTLNLYGGRWINLFCSVQSCLFIPLSPAQLSVWRATLGFIPWGTSSCKASDEQADGKEIKKRERVSCTTHQEATDRNAELSVIDIVCISNIGAKDSRSRFTSHYFAAAVACHRHRMAASPAQWVVLWQGERPFQMDEAES